MSSEARCSNSTFVNARGQKLLSHKLEPAAGIDVRGVLFYHHGLGDHAGRKIHIFDNIVSSGYTMFMFDAHGHGESEPHEEHRRVAIELFDHILDDASLYIATVVRPYMAAACPGGPLFLCGSSMGSAAVILLATTRPDIGEIAGVILNAAAVDATRSLVTRIQEPFAALANYFIPYMKTLPPISDTKCIRNPAALELRRQDPLLYRGGLRVCTACSMLDAFQRIQSAEYKLKVPILALHGSADEVCPMVFVERLIGNAPSQDKTLRVFPDALHDTLHDYECTEIVALMLSWVEERTQQ